ncbi:AMP-dependent synthetase/ligase [Sediminivirga luteola]|uniref:AMP-dependent synthetase/ligase n=1 Tax=Sediminivirga luteola TaxID=1774748 RepID=UPI001F5709E8|nr:AMP-dependent synthetase/ligase [Sediminivirga luteola]
MPASVKSHTATPIDYPLDDRITLGELIVRIAAEEPERVLFERKDSGGDWSAVSAARFRDQVLGVAKGLIAAGVRAGDRVGLLGRTSYEWTVADFAIWCAGAVTVPFYETSSKAQLAWMIEDSGVEVAFAESAAHAGRLDEALRHARDESGSGSGGSLPETLRSWVYQEGGFEELARSGEAVSDEDAAAQRAQVSPEDPATLIYTSGTTGPSKGCELSHHNFVLTAQAALHTIPEVFAGTPRCLLFLPLAHVFARFVQVLAVYTRSTLAHTADLADLPADLASFRPSYILAVPRVFEKVFNSALSKAQAGGKAKVAIFRRAERVAVAYSRALDAGRVPAGLRLQHRLFDRLVYSKLRQAMGNNVEYAVSGGGPLGAHLGHFYRGLGVTILEGYGLTETTAPVTVNLPAKSKIGTVGVPLPGCEIRIGEGEEVQAKGLCVFQGYWRNEEATAESFTEDGWFRTGDLGSMDADGYLTITGRSKEILVTSAGKNVAPAVLEDQLRRHPVVGQPVVIGDNRHFIAALFTLDPEMLPAWLKNHGLPEMDVAEAAAHPAVRSAIQDLVDRVNESVSRAEQIKKFTILPDVFSEASGHLSAKQSVKRHVVYEDYAEQIEEIYA